MKKKLVIRFVKFECALVAQQLEMAKGFNRIRDDTTHTFVYKKCFGLSKKGISFATESCNAPYSLSFDSNTERDQYLDKVVDWISEEQFGGNGKLEIGKPCMVSLLKETETKDWVMSRLLAILPEHIKHRYITQSKTNKEMFISWPYARPIASCVRPKIDGDIYSWEMEVEDEK